MENQLHLSPIDGDPLPNLLSYRCLVGRLIYLNATRPEVFLLHVLSRFMYEPCTMHMDAALRVLRYLKRSLGKGILLISSSDLHIRGYNDTNWGSCDKLMNPNIPNQPETHVATCSAIGKTVMAKDHYPRYSTILNQSD